ncbi:hypothetical protein PanWU01x14_081350 [Parasponia andersonii]|uniref:Uncharacterized protein n=1 Tax=Parasponia andersonii TaxID=3476 RepID=A0A2P5DAZ2_PARAD|nr:hypothetical protein PanWU01x14_081350 [Parasponia andersonii]
MVKHSPKPIFRQSTADISRDTILQAFSRVDVERRSPEADGVASSRRQEPTTRSSGPDLMPTMGFKGRSYERVRMRVKDPRESGRREEIWGLLYNNGIL